MKLKFVAWMQTIVTRPIWNERVNKKAHYRHGWRQETTKSPSSLMHNQIIFLLQHHNVSKTLIYLLWLLLLCFSLSPIPPPFSGHFIHSVRFNILLRCPYWRSASPSLYIQSTSFKLATWKIYMKREWWTKWNREIVEKNW